MCRLWLCLRYGTIFVKAFSLFANFLHNCFKWAWKVRRESTVIHNFLKNRLVKDVFFFKENKVQFYLHNYLEMPHLQKRQCH